MESQQPSQADVPPELQSDPYAGEKLDKELKAQGKDVGTTGNKAGYSFVQQPFLQYAACNNTSLTCPCP